MTETEAHTGSHTGSERGDAGAADSDKRTRILVVITRANVGGAQKHLLWLLAALRTRFSFRVIVGETGFLTERLDEIAIPWEHLHALRRRPSPTGDLGAMLSLRRAMRRHAPDIVHLHSFKAALLGRLAAVGLRTRVVVTAHGWSFTDGNPPARKLIGRWIEKALGPLTDRLVVVCRRDRDEALRHRLVDERRIRLIRNGAPEDEPRREAGVDRRNQVRLVCVGRLCPQKNQAALVDLVDTLPTDVELCLIGDGPDHDAILRLVEKRGLGRRVRLDTDNLEPGPQLRRADIYVSCSRWEGLPLSVIEALRAGLPVVATDVGGMNELVETGVNGFVHPLGDREAIRASVARLVADPALRAAMGARSRQFYEERFRIGNCVEETASLFEELLERPFGASGDA